MAPRDGSGDKRMSKRQRRRRAVRRRGPTQGSRPSTRPWVLAGIGAVAGAGLVAQPTAAQADDFTVTSHSDSSMPTPFPGTLRRAVFDANAHPGADRILFDSSLSGSTMFVQFGPLEITDAVSIEGLGSQDLSITGFDSTRIFTVDPATSGDPVTISGLRLMGGYSASPGGAVLNQDAKLTIRDCWFLDNASG